MKRLLFFLVFIGIFACNASLPLQLFQFSIFPDSCDTPSNTSTFNIGVNGGTAPYDYYIDGNLIFSNGPGSPVLPLTPSSAPHLVAVKDSSLPIPQEIEVGVGPTRSAFAAVSFRLNLECTGVHLAYNSAVRAGKNFDGVTLVSADAPFNDSSDSLGDDFFGLLPGNYTFTFKASDPNNSNCNNDLVFKFKVTRAPLSISAVSNLRCASRRNSGSITVTAAGGTPNFTYVLAGPSGPQTIGPTPNRTVNFPGLANGTYTVSVSDSGTPSCRRETTETVKRRCSRLVLCGISCH